jgi:hypothetical protein
MRLSAKGDGLRAIRLFVCADWGRISAAIALAIGKLARALTTRLMEILANEIDIEFEITCFANILITII